jgi:hexosaminidase
MVAWEEAAQCDIASSAVLQYWADIEHAKTAAQKGHSMILSPASRAYLDIKYDEDTPLGLTWAGTVDTKRAYTWDPASEVPGLPETRILGVEAPIWSETLRTMADVEFMAFPRLIGIAEIGWSPALGRNWEEYRQRLAAEGKRLEKQGVNFYRDPGVAWEQA